MKAMVLAAGEGTRLRPLTLDRPKPMVPVVNRPNIGHVLDKLSNAGIKDAAVNLWFHSDLIKKYVGKGTTWNIGIRYSQEKKLRGTAGSIAPLKDFFKKDSFVVLSGDGVSELNINELEMHHRKSGAIATVVLAQVDARFDYGLVKLNGAHQVTTLIEKPSWREAFAPYVNTGIYMFEPEILDWIPGDGPFDFARELFPRLLAESQVVNGYVLDGYWCDIGNLKEYRRCHKDILDGKTRVKIPGEEIEPGVWVGEKTRIGSGVSIEGPVAIGRGVTVEKSAKILPYSVIGDGCHISRGAVIDESILWEKVKVSAGVRVSGCVLADGAVLKENMAFFEGAVLSANPQ
ncbi:MAG: NDP-sugar synthase [Elusimicrobia bacterium]|nr:NDP-sugar synthase [Elusimicrobiota bacterium]